MHRSYDNDIPADLASMAELLRSERDELTPLELDGVMVAARQRAAQPRPGRLLKGTLMKSRLALTLVLALGLLMSMTGATLAISGIADSGNAGVAQYDDLGGTDEDLGPTTQSDDANGDDGDVPQEVEQVSAQGGDGSLPFTGFLAIPLLIGGVVLTATGAVMRRNARDDS
jgi:hypothetical protein